MKLSEPQALPFTSLLSDIERGQIKIPQFQRDFVWDLKKSANLMDSILKGYPIGTFIFWKTKDQLRAVRNIGNFDLPKHVDGDFVNYVLDGQQRLTSLFAALKGAKVRREDGKTEDYAGMYVDLAAPEDSQIVLTDIEGRNERELIKITDLIYGGLTLLTAFPKEYHQLIQQYQSRIQSYLYSVIMVKDVPIDIATEIFTRINVGGKSLSLFEIMVAKTYDSEKSFDLAEKFDALIESLIPVNYETISDATVLQTVSILLKKECTRKEILKLDKAAFVEVWPRAMDAIERSVDYFRGYYRIPVSKLIPYGALLVPFAYFFYHHPDKPTGEKQKYLEDFFWRCALSGRYSSGVESKLAQDVARIDAILKGELPKYNWAIDVSKEFIENNGWFSAGRSYIKAILCLYAYQQPKSFNDNSIVNISNAYLKQANSKNYHHFFPKSYLEKKGEDEFYRNHILNITIVDDFLNKREIKAKAPSDYMRKFKKVNAEHLAETMKSHLIGDLDEFGVWSDDYDQFFDQRAKWVSREFKKRIIPQDIDHQMKASIDEDQAEDLEDDE